MCTISETEFGSSFKLMYGITFSSLQSLAIHCLAERHFSVTSGYCV